MSKHAPANQAEKSSEMNAWLVAVVFTISILGRAAMGQSVPGEIVGHKLPVPGERVEGTTAKLSEVEAEIVASGNPQQQAERLLQYAISHHRGATDEIKLRVKQWRGQIKLTDSLKTLVDVALN